MAVNQMAVRMAGRDIATAKQYLDLMIKTIDRADQILAVESGFNDDTLILHAAQAKALLRETKRLADAFEGCETKPLETYTPSEELEALYA